MSIFAVKALEYETGRQTDRQNIQTMDILE